MNSHDYVIWSFEHQAWWRPSSMGYTREVAEAGHYRRDDATRIVKHANIIQPNETAMPLAHAREIVARGWHPLTPGTYDDGQGGVHIVVEELLAFYGYADTPQNRETVIDAAREAFGGAGTAHVFVDE